MKLIATLVFSLMSCLLFAAPTTFEATRQGPRANRRMHVEKGVLKWDDDQSEVVLFGVNYYPPFWWDYAKLKAAGHDIKQTILEDVSHFQRMGLTSLRLHTFDREFSDQDGNFIDNDHVEYLDYLISECAKRNIYVVLTPIAWWGTPNALPSSFSGHYKLMRDMVADVAGWKKQANFLKQYGQHVNRYTGLSYAEDPAIPVFELINEPLYPKDMTDDQVVDYINTLADGLRASGTRKPIFYSTWQNKQVACSKARIDGVTHSWYPTGLVAGRELKEDYLPRVADFPALRHAELNDRAKMIYEFDCADVLKTTLYPAMARTFRSVGVQIANQFQYEIMRLAHHNDNWKTHYLNLAYTPGKAIAFAIAAKAFERIPRGTMFPENDNLSFYGVTVNDAKNLSQYVTDTQFMYSNTTAAVPPHPEQLEAVWGVGNSVLVTTTGNGAYFLDKLATGDWLLEVYPSVVYVKDPFCGGMSEKARLYDTPVTLTVRLPDLKAGRLEMLSGTAASQTFQPGRPFTVKPGQYRILNAGVEPTAALPNRTFVLPPTTTDYSPKLTIDGPRQYHPRMGDFVVTASGYAPADVKEFVAMGQYTDGTVAFNQPFTFVGVGTYEARVPASLLSKQGLITVVVKLTTADGKSIIFPGELTTDKAFQPDQSWNVITASADSVFSVDGRNDGRLVTRYNPETQAMEQSVPDFIKLDACGFRMETKPLPPGAMPNAFRVIAAGDANTPAVEIGFQQKNGNAYGFVLPLTSGLSETFVEFRHLFPLWKTKGGELDPQELVRCSFITGNWICPGKKDLPHSLTVKSVDLVYYRECLRTYVLGEKELPRVVMFDAMNLPKSTTTATARLVPGMQPHTMGAQFVGSFGGVKDFETFYLPITKSFAELASSVKQPHAFVVTAKALYPQTTVIELVFREKDGSPWGIQKLPITTEWQEIEIPFESLYFFKHWAKWGGTPKLRGGEGDRFHLENLSVISTCFGKFLYPDTYTQMHGYVIQDIKLK